MATIVFMALAIHVLLEIERRNVEIEHVLFLHRACL